MILRHLLPRVPEGQAPPKSDRQRRVCDGGAADYAVYEGLV